MTPNVPYWFSLAIILVNLSVTVVLVYLIGHAKRERAYLKERGRLLDSEILHYNQMTAHLWDVLRALPKPEPEQAASLSGPPWDYADPQPFEEVED